jgi:hypothetical protein
VESAAGRKGISASALIREAVGQYLSGEAPKANGHALGALQLPADLPAIDDADLEARWFGK